MRKQTKIAAVVSAAALLALGASITSFAAARGTWMLVDGEWYCYDSNGDVYENTFCLSNGKEYYVGDDGMLVRSDWVEDDSGRYFVNSSGQKITNDWRLTTPYDDEEADEEWYYFGANGKMAENKKIVYKNNTYFFNSDGKMLTGWVTFRKDEAYVTVDEDADFSDGTIYYCDETGARVEGAWVYTTEPGSDEDDADAEQYWYWFQNSGKAKTGKGTSIKGQTFLFDTEGRMLTGWVAYTKSDGTWQYTEIGYEGSDVAIEYYKDDTAYYYCAYSEDGELGDGHVQKNRWYKTWKPVDSYEEDEDDTKYWYWLDKNGKVYVPSASDALAIRYKLTDAVLESKGKETITAYSVNSKNYFFNENGEMVSDFIDIYDVTAEKTKPALNVGMYYLGGSNDGSMKTGSQSIKDENGDTYKFYFGTKSTAGYQQKGLGITGNKDGKLYYKGLLITADDYKYQLATIKNADGTEYTFLVNSNGRIQSSKTVYKEDGDELIDLSTDTMKENEVDLAKIFDDDAVAQWKNSIHPEALEYVEGQNKVDVINVNAVMPYDYILQ